MLRSNNIKNKILIFGFVFIFFGMFFVVGRAEAQTAAATCACDVRVDGGQNCGGEDKLSFPVPLAKISRKQLVRDALNTGCVDSVSIMNEVIRRMGTIEDIVEVRDEQSCNSVSYFNSFSVFGGLNTFNFEYNISCSFKEESTAGSVSGDSVKTDCTKSPLGCNLDIKSLNKLKLTGAGGVQILLGRAIKTMMGIIGSIALLMFAAGGFMWMTASGNAERTAKALKIITWSTLGIIVIFSAYALVQFVFSAF